jgi:RNA polymerase sigma factor (TIGR02999 family)
MVPAGGEDVTSLLERWSGGDQRALDELWPLVYDELHAIAARSMRRERGDHTLQATALVNEAYLRLVDQSRVSWHSSLQFLAIAAQMMRRILIDHARRAAMAKRGGGVRAVSLEHAPEPSLERPSDILALDEALTRLAEAEPQLARIVEMRFFGGMTSEEIAEALELSVPTVTRRWRLARAWLYNQLSGEAVDDA